VGQGQDGAYKYPRSVEFIDELPKSGSGKILWRELQEREQERYAEDAVDLGKHGRSALTPCSLSGDRGWAASIHLIA
jgi:hypothetical protein